MLEVKHAKFCGAVAFSALIKPVDDRSLIFEDGSQLAVRLVQRAGPVIGGPFDGALMTEWGLHEIATTYGEGQGFIEFAHASGDKAYFQFMWTGRAVFAVDGTPAPVMFGSWSARSGSGRYRALSGAGTIDIAIPSETERNWQFSGTLSL